VPRFGGTAANRRIAVALSFDFDAESVWLGGLNTNTPSALSRGAYAANEGVPRVLKLLGEYDLPATFFIPGYTAEIHPNETKAISDGGFEIGHHGYMHEPPTSLTHDEERVMIERGIEALVNVTGKAPVGYRSPSWELSPSTFSLLAAAGVNIGSLLAGAFIVEYLFAINGLGYSIVQAVNQRDYLVVQGIALVVAIAYVILQFAVDLLFTVVDPRVARA